MERLNTDTLDELEDVVDTIMGQIQGDVDEWPSLYVWYNGRYVCGVVDDPMMQALQDLSAVIELIRKERKFDANV